MTDEERERRLAVVRLTQRAVLPFAESHPHLKEFSEFLEEFNKETERGAALAAAAFIDDLLLRTLEAFLRDTDSSNDLLKGANAPLSAFSSRIKAAHAMGLISDEERRECDRIRGIRNEFAHKIRMTFDDNRVRGLCSALTYRAKPYGNVTVSTRGAFTTAAVSLILKLTNRPFFARNKKLDLPDWPF